MRALNSRKAKKAYINQAVEHYKQQLNLGTWTIRTGFYNELAEWPSEKDQCTADCTASPEYKEAEIKFTLDEVPSTKSEIDHLIVHEMTHAILWPMTHFMDRWAGEDDERKEASRFVLELVTSDLDRILYKHLPHPASIDDATKVRERTRTSSVRGEDSKASEEA